jgi:hypothetical protein
VRSSGIAVVVAAGALRAVCASCRMRDGAATEELGELSGALRGAGGSGVLVEGST